MLQLTGRIREYAWGSPTAIPDILGQEPTGEPQAEYWLGAHPSSPSTVDGIGLDELLHQHPDWVGDRTYRAFGDTFPVLMKVLAADQPLSLQAHPNKEMAEKGFARENQARIPLDAPQRIYRDDWPKPELIIALTSFDGLCGFREPAKTVELFDALGCSQALDSVIGPLSKRKGPAALAEVFLDILSQDHPEFINVVLDHARDHTSDDSEVGQFARTAMELNVFFPQDPSILAALLMNRFHLEPGQGLFLRPRTLHAYLHGVGVEVMACSDNVLRGGLTKKHIDVDELIHVVSFKDCPAPLVETEVDGGFTRYLTPTPEFAAWRAELTHHPIAIPRSDSCRIALAIDGDAAFQSGDATLNVSSGQAVLLTYGEEVQAAGSATVYVCSPGV